jgi:archaemetzincin
VHGDIEGSICIRPVGAVDGRTLQWLERDLALYLGLPVRTTRNMPVPAESYEEGRGQYYSTRIIGKMLREVPDGAFKLLGVIDRDLCIPILTFVFGEAQLDGTVALVSLTRLRQEFYGLPPDRFLFHERLRKESLHELGHTFGLIHCPSRECVMSLSNTVIDVDRKGRSFCRHCLDVVLAKAEAGR